MKLYIKLLAGLFLFMVAYHTVAFRKMMRRLAADRLVDDDQTKQRSLKIAWLMSFPNSGTSFTMQHVRRSANTILGTNYAMEGEENDRESIPIDSNHPEGPFWLDKDVFPDAIEPKEFVMVKTHCGGYCFECHPEIYLETMGSFKQECLFGFGRKKEGNKIVPQETYYGMDQVSKAIHLIRDPFSNTVSRYHHRRNEGGLEDYENSVEGFRRYCFDLKEEFNLSWRVRRLKEARRVILDVPCGADILRWVEWHNKAFALAADEGLDTLVLHYEDYMVDMEETTSKLLNFLKLKARPNDSGAKFIAGKKYQSYFAEKEKEIIRDAVRKMATRQTWSQVYHYFANNHTSPPQ